MRYEILGTYCIVYGRGLLMSESWRFRINIAIIVAAIAVALHMLGIG